MELTKNNCNFGYRKRSSFYHIGRLRRYLSQHYSRKYREIDYLSNSPDTSSMFLKYFNLFNFSLFFTFVISLKAKKIKWIKISELEKYKRVNYLNHNGDYLSINWRPERGDYGYNWEELEKSILKHGLKMPLVLCGEQIIDGNHRFQVARKLFPLDKKIPCVFEYTW